MSKLLRAVVLEENAAQPIHPQLVDVTIRWVDAERSYRVTLALALSTFILSGGLAWWGFPSQVVLMVTLGSLLGQAAMRAYIRFVSRKTLMAMRQKLGIKD